MDDNRRQFFRLEYPPGSGPKLVSSGIKLEVLDISEQGLLIQVKNSSPTVKVGGGFTASLTFPDGESMLVFGNIVRVNEDKLSIKLRRPIPLRIIMAEQRRIIQNFKQRA